MQALWRQTSTHPVCNAATALLARPRERCLRIITKAFQGAAPHRPHRKRRRSSLLLTDRPLRDATRALDDRGRRGEEVHAIYGARSAGKSTGQPVGPARRRWRAPRALARHGVIGGHQSGRGGTAACDRTKNIFAFRTLSLPGEGGVRADEWPKLFFVRPAWPYGAATRTTVAPEARPIGDSACQPAREPWAWLCYKSGWQKGFRPKQAGKTAIGAHLLTAAEPMVLLSYWMYLRGRALPKGTSHRTPHPDACRSRHLPRTSLLEFPGRAYV